MIWPLLVVQMPNPSDMRRVSVPFGPIDCFMLRAEGPQYVIRMVLDNVITDRGSFLFSLWTCLDVHNCHGASPNHARLDCSLPRLARNTKCEYKSKAAASKFARFINAEAGRWQYPPNCTSLPGRLSLDPPISDVVAESGRRRVPSRFHAPTKLASARRTPSPLNRPFTMTADSGSSCQYWVCVR